MSTARADLVTGSARPSALEKYRPLVPGLALAAGVAPVAQVVEAAERAWRGRPYLESIVLALLLGAGIITLGALRSLGLLPVVVSLAVLIVLPVVVIRLFGIDGGPAVVLVA